MSFSFCRGVQKQFSKGVPVYPLQTVQSLLEIALLNLKKKPLNKPIVYVASRTDTGVHAFCNAGHVDLEFPEHVQSVYGIIHSLNRFLTKGQYDLRVLGMQVVPPTFSARHSVSKKRYLYRFAILKPDVLTHLPIKRSIIPIPIIEKNRCHFINHPQFNPSLAEEATRLFIGYKDFKAFMGRPSHREEVNTERNIEELTISKGTPFIETPESNYYDFWNVTCTGRSFLYRMVRRIVGVLIAVGQERLTLAEVEKMFINPTKYSWCEKAIVVPGHGLYLTNVFYKEEDLLHEIDSKEEIVDNNYQL